MTREVPLALLGDGAWPGAAPLGDDRLAVLRASREFLEVCP